MKWYIKSTDIPLRQFNVEYVNLDGYSGSIIVDATDKDSAKNLAKNGYLKRFQITNVSIVPNQDDFSNMTKQNSSAINVGVGDIILDELGNPHRVVSVDVGNYNINVVCQDGYIDSFDKNEKVTFLI